MSLLSGCVVVANAILKKVQTIVEYALDCQQYTAMRLCKIFAKPFGGQHKLGYGPQAHLGFYLKRDFHVCLSTWYMFH